MSDYNLICRDILKKNGPLLGSELQKLLIENSHLQVKAGNARQILFRLKEEKKLLTTDPVRFIGNQLLYFLPKQNIKKKLTEILPKHAKAFDRIYHALVDQDGFLFWNQFAKISAGVTNEVSDSSHKSAREIYKDLYKLGLVQKIEDFNFTAIIKANEEWVPTLDDSYTKLYKRQNDLAFNRQLTDDLLKWLEKMNLAGWNSTHLLNIENENEGYNGYLWDAIGYSYLWGLYKTTKPESLYYPATEKTGSLIVIESVLTREMKMYDLTGFISRINVQYGRLKKGGNFKVIPICFVQSIEEETLKLARAKGIMVISIADVFGTKILEALKAVRDIDPRNIDADALVKVLEIADSSGQDGKFGALKGYIFNFMVASLFQNYGFKTLIGAKYDDKKGGKCECDVKIIDGDELIILCEAKGNNNDVQIRLGETEKETNTVKYFFERTCKIVGDITGKEIFPVFITSGEFTPEAKEYLDNKNNTKRMQRLFKKYNFPKSVYYDRASLFELFGNEPAYTEYKKVLQEFFRVQKKVDGKYHQQ